MLLFSKGENVHMFPSIPKGDNFYMFPLMPKGEIVENIVVIDVKGV